MALIRPGEEFKKEISVITEKTGRECSSNLPVMRTLIHGKDSDKREKLGACRLLLNETNDVNRPENKALSHTNINLCL